MPSHLRSKPHAEHPSSLPAPLFLSSVGMIFLLGCSGASSRDPSPYVLGPLESGAIAQVGTGALGVRIEGGGLASASQPEPAMLELFDGASGQVELRAAGYERLEEREGEVVGTARVEVDADCSVTFEDRWSVRDGALHLAREVAVHGTSDRAFLSAFALDAETSVTRSEVQYFAPGVVYGSTEGIHEAAIGGRDVYGPGGGGVMRVREDRLPIPLFGVRFADGASITLIHLSPTGETTREESHDVDGMTLVDERYRFGALGTEHPASTLRLGFWYPGTEGEVTYPALRTIGKEGGVKRYRRRYHPLRDGLTQSYEIAIRLAPEQSWDEYFVGAYRYGFAAFAPEVRQEDIDVARQSIVDLVLEKVATVDDRTGIPQFWDATTNRKISNNALLGFIGKNIENAEHLLRHARLHPSDRSETERDVAYRIIESFLRLPTSPPDAEGFSLTTGAPAFYPELDVVHLRPLGDDGAALLRAYALEANAGRVNESWVAWARSLGEWMLTRQRDDGSFARSFVAGSGEAFDDSPNSTFVVIEFLARLADATGENEFLDAAIAAGEFAFARRTEKGFFSGGTIDQPNVIDGEAGAVSMEAYLALYEATNDPIWLDRARTAADFAETWMYVWNVPMPDDEDDGALHVKKGVPTIGVQLNATGISMCHYYMATNVDAFVELHRHTGDPHYLDVARILLHGTKALMAMPGRTFDLYGPGLQQEHFSISSPRGYGSHRWWQPWIAAAQLNGILITEERSKEVFEAISN